jgi:hypothetical protein
MPGATHSTDQDAKLLTPVPAPRSTHTRSLRSRRRAAHAASIGLRPHRKFVLNLSSAAQATKKQSAECLRQALYVANVCVMFPYKPLM